MNILHFCCLLLTLTVTKYLQIKNIYFLRYHKTGWIGGHGVNWCKCQNWSISLIFKHILCLIGRNFICQWRNGRRASPIIMSWTIVMIFNILGTNSVSIFIMTIVSCLKLLVKTSHIFFLKMSPFHSLC